MNDLGVAVLLAAANAESIEPTVNIAITSILAEIIFNSSDNDSTLISGTSSCNRVLSASCAVNAEPIEMMQNISGLNHNFSLMR